MNPSFGNFLANLPYMGKGMLSIFLVISAIILATVLLIRLFPAKD